MASATQSCQFCGANFTGYGKDHNSATQDAKSTAMNHELNCPSNPANQE